MKILFSSLDPDPQDAAPTLNALAGTNYRIVLDDLFPVRTPINPWPNMRLEGDGEGGFIVDQWQMNGENIFNHVGSSSSPTPGIVLNGVVFDNLANYPEDETLGREELSHYCGAISLMNVCDTVIEECRVRGFTRHGVYISGTGWNNRTEKTKFYKGAYNGKVIAYYASSPFSHRGAVIRGNESVRNGPQAWSDAGNQTFASSVDGIQVDDIDEAVISGNSVRECSGVGIRVEGTKRFQVTGNTIENVGQDGVAAYNGSFDGVISGNIIKDWGALPRAASFVSHAGQTYVCREYPHAGLNPLPSDPSTSDWFEMCPYSLSGVSNIRAYSASDYSLLPFRGYAGITTPQYSSDIIVSGNIITGDIAIDGNGRNTHASDFGLSVIHCVNSPVDGQGARCKFGDNLIRDTRVADIYWPEFADPSAGRGATAARLAISGVSSDQIARGSVVVDITADVGTVTLNPSYNTLSYTRIGPFIHLKGQLRVQAINSPGGNFWINNVPGALANLAQRAEDPIISIRPTNVNALPGMLYGTMQAGEGRIVVSRYDDSTGQLTGGAASLKSNSIIGVDGWYEVG